MNTSFLPEVVDNKISNFKSGIASIMPEHIERWQVIKDWDKNVSLLNNFGNQRPQYMRQHIINYFGSTGVTGVSNVTINTDSSMGWVKVNTIEIKEGNIGVKDPGNWTGVYFKGVPVKLEALAKEGYTFDHWVGVDNSIQNNKNITVNLEGNINITAVFKKVTAAGTTNIVVSQTTKIPTTTPIVSTVTPSQTPNTPSTQNTTNAANTTSTTSTPSTPNSLKSVNYVIINDWGAGATIEVTIKNNGNTALNNWNVSWKFSGNQKITNLWNADYSQNGADVTVKSTTWNGVIDAGSSVSFGFNISYSGSNDIPKEFTVI